MKKALVWIFALLILIAPALSIIDTMIYENPFNVSTDWVKTFTGTCAIATSGGFTGMRIEPGTTGLCYKDITDKSTGNVTATFELKTVGNDPDGGHTGLGFDNADIPILDGSVNIQSSNAVNMRTQIIGATAQVFSQTANEVGKFSYFIDLDKNYASIYKNGTLIKNSTGMTENLLSFGFMQGGDADGADYYVKNLKICVPTAYLGDCEVTSINRDFDFNGSSFPYNAHSYNSSSVVFYQNATIVNNTVNCSLILNGVKNETKQYSNLVDPYYYFNINFTKTLIIPSKNNYSISCKSLIDSTVYNTSLATFYLDNVFPSIQTSFINNSLFFKSISASFNFTDDFSLFSYNISIDGVQKAYESNILNTTKKVNFNTSLLAYAPGNHTLSVKLADGHTANEIGEYKVSNGLFNDYLRYEWDFDGRTQYAKLTHDGGSIFDDFSTEKKKDRYVWTFEPSSPKPVHVFIVESSDEIYIIDAPNTYLKKWIIFNNKWMDFDLYGENTVIDIQRLNDKKVKVTISNIQHPGSQRYQSIGDLNIITQEYVFYKLNASVSFYPTIFEGSLNPYTLILNTTNINTKSTSANLVWGGSSKGSGTKSTINNNSVQYANSFTAESNLSLVSWVYFFNVSGFPFNISGNQTFVAMNITNCSGSSYIILNYTVYDEETRVKATSNVSMELDLSLTSTVDPSLVYNFSVLKTSNDLVVCLPNGMLNVSNYTLDALCQYEYQSHVIEHHYIENYVLGKNNIPRPIPLYDLKGSDSTSFLINYQDENYLYVEGAIVDLLRKYISDDGQFISVEHGKTDPGGQTRLHLVTEDVIYKFNIWVDGELVYTTGEYVALCQATPCQINLRKKLDENLAVSQTANIIYSITNDAEFKSAEQITFSFSTKDGTATTINMTVHKSSFMTNETVCSTQTTTSAGSVVCSVPISMQNATYTAKIWKDGEFIGWRHYSLEPNSQDAFGKNVALFLSAIGYMSLVLMAISTPPIAVLLGIVGLVVMSLMNVLDTGSIFGIGSSFIWLIIAGAILIWKYQQRRVS